jgi:gliding motility-associated protein GldE
LEPEPHISLNNLIVATEQDLQPLYLIEGLFILFILLFGLVFISVSEYAYLSLNPDDKKRLEGLHKTRSKNVLQLLKSPEKLIATLIIANSLITFLLVLLSVFLLNQFPSFSMENLTGILLQIITISSVILIFSKILPKLIIQKRVLRIVMVSVYPIIIAQKFFSPLVFLFIRINSFLNNSLLQNRSNLSIDTLSDTFGNNEDAATEDRKILLGIVNFGNIEVSEIMKQRMDVMSVDIETDFPELIHLINESGYSRIPVFTETLDNIKGILYIKDLLPFILENKNFKWQELIRPGYYVPETKKIKDLLQEFLEKKIHMAIVVDEYGGTEGIITLEDVLEEIVGEITDESDEVESYFSRIDESNFIFDGKILLNDFFKITQVSEESFESIRGDADTLAGLILEIKGEIPPVNQTIIVKNFSFTILSVDDRRIKKVKFTLEKNTKTR